MRVALICSSLPAHTCGVSLYTHRLARALQEIGVEAQVFTYEQEHARIARLLHATRPDCVHLQYPGLHFRWTVHPLLLRAGRPFVVTIHEYPLSHRLRRVLIRMLARSADALIFPSPEVSLPLLSSLRRIPPTAWIPVGPLVEGAAPQGAPAILVFGKWDKSKDLPLAREILNAVCAEFSLPVVAVGAVLSRGLPHFVRALRVPHGALAGILSQHRWIAIQFYRDGPSERRTTLRTLLEAGIPTIVLGEGDLPHWASCAYLRFAKTTTQVLAAVREFLEAYPERKCGLPGWREIAVRHLAFYRSLRWLYGR